MEDIIHRLKQAIDLNSYTSSPYYGGWFVTPTWSNVERFIHFLNQHYQVFVENDVTVVGQASIHSQADLIRQYRMSKQDYKSYIEPMVDLAIFKKNLTKADWDALEAFSAPQILQLSGNVLIDLLKLLHRYGHGYGEIIGRVFVVLERIDAVKYFADEPSIGLIGLSEQGAVTCKQIIADMQYQ